MRRLGKRIERLVKRPPTKIILRLGIVRVAPCVDLVPARAEQRRGEHFRDGTQQANGEIDRRRRGEAQLARGGLVRVRRPWRRLGARDMLWVRFGDGRGVPRRVDLLYTKGVGFSTRGSLIQLGNYVRRERRFRARDEVRVVHKVMEGRKTHRAGEENDVGDVLWSVHRVGAVCAPLRKFGVVRHDKREALAVDNMPVERVELRSVESHQVRRSSYCEFKIYAREPMTSPRAYVQGHPPGSLRWTMKAKSTRGKRKRKDRRTNFAMYPARSPDTAIIHSQVSHRTSHKSSTDARKQANPVSSQAP